MGDKKEDNKEISEPAEGVTPVDDCAENKADDESENQETSTPPEGKEGEEKENIASPQEASGQNIEVHDEKEDNNLNDCGEEDTEKQETPEEAAEENEENIEISENNSDMKEEIEGENNVD